MLVRYYELGNEVHNICPCRTLLHTIAVLFYSPNPVQLRRTVPSGAVRHERPAEEGFEND